MPADGLGSSFTYNSVPIKESVANRETAEGAIRKVVSILLKGSNLIELSTGDLIDVMNSFKLSAVNALLGCVLKYHI